MIKLRVIAAATAIGLLSGCATLPNMKTQQMAATPKPFAHDKTPPITWVKDSMGVHLDTPDPSLCVRQVSISTTKQATMGDLSPLLYAQGIAFAPGGYASDKIYLPKWSGNICDLGTTLADYVGGTWSWNGHTLSLTDKKVVSGYVPANLVKSVAADMKALGIPLKVSQLGYFTGKLTQDQYTALDNYFNRLRKGVSMVTLHVAVVSLHSTYSDGSGFSWKSFTAALGSASMLAKAAGSAASSTASAAASTVAATSAAVNGLKASVSKGSATLKAVTPGVSVDTVLSLLASYGSMHMLQNASVKALSGTTVKLSSVTNTPYVTGVGVASSGSSSTTIGTSDTSNAKSGLTLSVTPLYSPGQNYVTVNIKADNDAVQGFVNLSAGNQIGSLSQPVTQKQSIDSQVTVAAGDPAVIGGLTYTTDSRQYNAPVFAKGLSDSSTNMTRDQLFIIIRPTVTVYH